MILNLRSIFPTLLVLIGTVSAHAQSLSDGIAKGGGTYNGCNPSLTVDLDVMPLGNMVQQFTSIVDSGSTIIGGYTWTYYTDQVQQSFEENVQVTYPSPGESPVCLTVSAFDMLNSQPCQTTTCRFIEILQDPSCLEFQPDFTIASVNGNSIGFEEISPSTATVSITWDFGDGFTALDQQGPVHEFVGPGPHEICLTVTGPAPMNCTATVCKWLYLGPADVPCDQLLEPGFMHFQNDNIVVVLDTSIITGQSSTTYWDFGDGNTAEGAVAVHVYEFGPGPYEICASVDLWGPLVADTCEAIHCKMVGETAIGLDERHINQLSIWPVPSTDQINISGLRPGPVEIEVRDALGRLVFTRSASVDLAGIHLSISDLASGVHMIHCTQGEVIHKGRFVKQ